METHRTGSGRFRFAVVLAIATSGLSCDHLGDLGDIWDQHRPDGGQDGQSCSGTGQEACPASTFCEQPSGTCAEPPKGTCRPRPEVCTQQYAPVCGCDGKTYGNDCQRQAAGVSKRADGVCADRVEVGVGQSCGGFTPPPIRVCQPGVFCMIPAGSCDIADIPGVCEETPTVCTREYNPVCGCDGKTYGNDCERRAARIGLDHAGAC